MHIPQSVHSIRTYIEESAARVNSKLRRLSRDKWQIAREPSLVANFRCNLPALNPPYLCK